MKRSLLILLSFFLSLSLLQAQNPGELDLTFNADGINFGDGANSRVWTSTLQPDGKIIISGCFTEYNRALLLSKKSLFF